MHLLDSKLFTELIVHAEDTIALEPWKLYSCREKLETEENDVKWISF